MTGPAPSTVATEMKVTPSSTDKKAETPSSKKEDNDVCMQDSGKLGDSSPAEIMDKGPHSPLTWINPASDTANAQNSGHNQDDSSSREPSNIERVDQKYDTLAQNERDAEMV